ncbi:hypothetical protein Gorai_003881 [Gossypium raimondii]|uniref:Uncharacterized protein n=1 Tax=Gossypium raimondii TaxID=29730 RepID=A0A7J8QGJ2_GOSRA|nr:hypothetical protein [Gossypium raimondii]
MNGNSNGFGSAGAVAATEFVRRHHRHETGENQCSSAVVKRIKAPVPLVWSLVRRFDQPQKYKPFVSRCVAQGNLEIGSLREVDVKSGLPATTSTERLELLDDDEHILSIRIIGGDHRLKVHKNMHVRIFNKEAFYCENLVKEQCERLINGLVAAKTGGELSFEEL